LALIKYLLDLQKFKRITNIFLDVDIGNLI